MSGDMFNNPDAVAELISMDLNISKSQILKKIEENNDKYEIPEIFIFKSSAEKNLTKLLQYSQKGEIKQVCGKQLSHKKIKSPIYLCQLEILEAQVQVVEVM